MESRAKESRKSHGANSGLPPKIFFVVGRVLKGIVAVGSELGKMDIYLPLIEEAPAVPERLSEQPPGTAIGPIVVKAARLSARIPRYLYSEDFRHQARRRPQAFTRRRKGGLVGVVSIILNRIRQTPQVEWDDYTSRG